MSRAIFIKRASSPIRRGSEPDVLQRFRCVPVEPCGLGVVAAPGGEVAESHPCARAVADRVELRAGLLGRAEPLLGLVEPAALEQRAPEPALGRAALARGGLA